MLSETIVEDSIRSFCSTRDIIQAGTADSPFLTVDEVAKILRMEPGRVYYLLRKGEIPCCRLGKGKYLIKKSLLIKCLDDREVVAGKYVKTGEPVK